MNPNEFVDGICQKYCYSEDLNIAIKLALPLMLERYKDRTDEVYKLFDNVRIFATDDMSAKHFAEIEREMTGEDNHHVEEAKTDPYESERDPGAAYCFSPVYDENMNVTSEKRWLVVADIKGYHEDEYRALFGTSINMPYFLHELNHAFAMQNPIYKKEENCLFCKHGMYEEILEFQNSGDKVKVEHISEDDIIVEEIINEKTTQDMITKLLRCDSYREALSKLNAIGYVPSSYSATQILIAETLETTLGQEQLDKWRIDNDLTVRQRFCDASNSSQITATYCQGEDAYSFLSNTVFQMFKTSCNSFRMSVDDYGKTMRVLMFNALAPIYGYQESLGLITFDKYHDVRANACGEEEFVIEESGKGK